MSSDSSINLDAACAKIVKDTIDSMLCLVKSGLMTLVEFNAFIATGFSVSGTATDDGAGNTTCVITVGTGA